MARPAFDPDKQDRLFEALERGESVAAACRYAACSKDTIYRWVRAAKAGQGTPEQAAFADRFERATASDEASPVSGDHLSEADLIELLEAEARDGHVVAIKLLLERPWERRRAEPAKQPAPSGSSLIDQLAARRRARPT